jgi:putative tricarboxylic transport membrane protein
VDLLNAVLALAHPEYLVLLLVGTAVGLALGLLPSMVLPGLAVTLGVTLQMDHTSAIVLFASMMGPTAVAGSVPAILVGVPGEPVNAATVFDGYPMAQRGEAGRALGISATASCLGAFFGLGFLIVLIPVMQQTVLAFGPPEIFMLVLVGLFTIVIASQSRYTKGMLAGALGMAISLVGFSPVGGSYRYSFGSETYLYEGVPLVPFFIGLFAVSEVIRMHVTRHEHVPRSEVSGFRGVLGGIVETLRQPVCLVRSSAVGVGIGVIPGVGGAVANFVSYVISQRLSPDPGSFGRGNPQGIISSEAGNDAKDGGSLIPTVAFGIPGSSVMALFLGALTVHGFAVGPMFLIRNLELLWLVIAALMLSNILASTLVVAGAPALAKVVTAPKHYVAVIVLVLSLTGTLLSRGNVLDLFQAVLWGFGGYWFVQHGFPPVPLIIGYILGPRTEAAYIQSLQISEGSYSVFWSSPITITLWAVLAVLAAFTLWPRRRSPEPGDSNLERVR